MKRASAAEPVTPARIERALALCAYLVARDEGGLDLVPIMDRLEAELARARREEDPIYRARRLLSACTASDGQRAICQDEKSGLGGQPAGRAISTGTAGRAA